LYEDNKKYLGEKMSYVSWDPGNAGKLGNLQGQMTGYVAGLYSLPGMANISAAPTEVLNQNGYTVYQDTDTGRYNLVRDNYPNSSSIWTSQSLGVTLDCSGDQLVLKGMNEGKGDGGDGGDGGDDGTVESQLGLLTGTNFNYSGYTNEARNSFAQNSQAILNRLNAARTSSATYQSTVGLKTDETIDPVTGAVVDKEKSAAINELTMSEATKHKFDNIAKLINKVAEKQNEAEVTVQDKSTDYAVAAGVAVGATGALAGAGKGGAIGAAIGSIIPGAGTAVGAVVGAIGGAILGGLAGLGVGKAVKAHDEGKAETANNEATKEAEAAGAELKEALEGLSDEELIAFQRYYYEQSGVKVTEVLKGLETDDDSSKIAQGAGFDNGYLTSVFENIDSANETIKTDEDDENEAAEAGNGTDGQTNATKLTYSQSAQLDVLQQNANLYRQYWQQALNGDGTLEVNGKTMTADELSELYIKAYEEVETYLESIGVIETQDA